MNYAILARLTIGAGTVLILTQHYLGPFGDANLLIVLGAMMIGIGIFMIPDVGTSHK